MAKRFNSSQMALEIKREYLREHLGEVKGLVLKWMPELRAVAPMDPQKGSWGWQSVYRPLVEQDTDSNHMLRRHLRSRVLWHHHAIWERHLHHVLDLYEAVRGEACRCMEPLWEKRRQYHEDYLGTALWKGFEMACGREVRRWYNPPDDNRGVFYGSYRIELSVENAEERANMEQGHWDLIRDVAELKEMRGLADLWGEVLRLQEQMQTIVGKALKSNDILYPCSFCKHLWK